MVDRITGLSGWKSLSCSLFTPTQDRGRLPESEMLSAKSCFSMWVTRHQFSSIRSETKHNTLCLALIRRARRRIASRSHWVKPLASNIYHPYGPGHGLPFLPSTRPARQACRPCLPAVVPPLCNRDEGVIACHAPVCGRAPYPPLYRRISGIEETQDC